MAKIPVKTARNNTEISVSDSLYIRVLELIEVCKDNDLVACNSNVDSYVQNDPTGVGGWEVWIEYREGEGGGWYIQLNGNGWWHSFSYRIKQFGEFFGVSND